MQYIVVFLQIPAPFVNRGIQRANPPLATLTPRPLGAFLADQPIELVGYFAPLARHVFLMVLFDWRLKLLDYCP